jgi:[acyl-carrier-protein] S-malonyltransferase
MIPVLKIVIATMLMLKFASSFTPAAFRRMAPRSMVMSTETPVKTEVSYKTAFMFPGQGAQTVGMGAALCEEVPEAKELYEKASAILGYNLLEKCVNGPKEELDSTVISQPAIFVSSMAALEKLKKENPAAIDEATVCMGLSLGEYTALCFAGSISFEDGVKLTKARGEAMQAASEAAKSGMVAVVGLDKDTVQQICDEAKEKSGAQVEIANYLMNGNYVVSGAIEACDAAKEIAPEKGARMAMPLSVAGAFHTSYMQPAVERLQKVLDEVEVKAPRLPVISNVDAKPHSDPKEIKEILAKQVTSPVQWETIITEMLDADFGEAYELGPGTVCRGIVKRFSKKNKVNNIQA